MADLKDNHSTSRKQEHELLEGLWRWTVAQHSQGHRKHSGIIDDWMQENGIDTLPFGISKERLALTAYSREEEVARYDADVQTSKAADVLLTTHAMMLLNAHRWGRVLDADRPTVAVVFDEADRLLEVARSHIEGDLPVLHIQRTMEVAGETAMAALAGALQRAVQSLGANHPHVAVRIGANSADHLAVRTAVLALVEASKAGKRRLCSKLEGANAAARDILVEALALYERVEAFGATLERNSDDALFATFSPVRRYPGLRIARSHYANVLQRLLMPVERLENAEAASIIKSAVFTSATLGRPAERDAQKAFKGFLAEIGASGARNLLCDDLFGRYEPAHFGEMRFVLADPRAPLPFEGSQEETPITSTAFLDYVGALIRAAKAAREPVLVLAVSFADCAGLAERLREVGAPVIEHIRGQPLRSYVHLFKERARQPEGALLITPAGWEGLDLPGLVKHLVIPRLPFAPPNAVDALIQRERLAARGYGPDAIQRILNAQSIEAAMKRFSQGLGRGIRQPDDRVTVWIADRRFPLHESVLRSMAPLGREAIKAKARTFPAFAQCIPERFRRYEYPQARVFTIGHALVSSATLKLAA